MFSQKFFTIKTSFLKQQTKVGKTTKFIMGNDERVIKFYKYPLFPWWSMLVWIWWFMNLHPTPFWAFENQERKLFFLHWVCMINVCFFFFWQVKLYAAMGSAYLGQGSIPPIELSLQKLETENQRLAKKLKKIKGS